MSQLLTKLGGQLLTFIYNAGTLSKIQDQYGNTLNITISNTVNYCTNLNLITAISFLSNSSTTANNYSYTYTSNNSCQISKATFPDNTYKQYKYDSNNNYIMSNVIDENQNIYDNFTSGYISSPTNLGYVTMSNSLGSNANINKYIFNYTTTSTTATDSLGNINTLNNTLINGINYTKGSSSICQDCKGLSKSNANYDTYGNLISTTDFNGFSTNYTYTTTP